MIICDTSGLLAAYDQQEPDGPTVRDLLDGETGTLIVSPFVLAELDYMLLSRAGVQAGMPPCLSGWQTGTKPIWTSPSSPRKAGAPERA